MKRNPERTAGIRYDVVVIGGGINGIATASEAAARGLRTCLVEAADFMSQTSANSLKIVHGGFRYLQQANFRRIRESCRERRILMKIAPHLVHPLKCVMPTGPVWTLRSLPGLLAASAVNGLISFDRSQGLPPDKQIPAGGVMSKRQLVQLLGSGMDRPGVTGAAVWHDGMAVNTERLGFAFLHAGAGNGLDALNYCPVVGFGMEQGRIAAVQVQDLVQGRSFDIACDFVINAAGAWAGELLQSVPSLGRRSLPHCRVMNLVVRRQLFPAGQAVGLFGDGRAFFFVPWRGFWMIGTDEAPWSQEAGRLRATEEDVVRFLGRINQVYPGEPLRLADVCLVHKGLVPGQGRPDGSFRLLDHEQEGVANMITLLPVKYTTARDVGQKAVDCCFRKTGKPFRASPTAEMPLDGGDMKEFAAFCRENLGEAMAAGLGEPAARHLLGTHGSSYRRILAHGGLLQPVAGSEEVLLAEVAHAVDQEMAVKLADVVLRRTDLGTAERPGPETLACCAELMASRLGWSREKVDAEIADCVRFHQLS